MGRPASGKWRAEPRSEPDSGHPTVRDRRGALGDVTHGEPRNPTRKSKERLWSLLAYRCARPGSIPTTRTSGSVGGQGQQRPWSTRPLVIATPSAGHRKPRSPPRSRVTLAMNTSSCCVKNSRCTTVTTRRSGAVTSRSRRAFTRFKLNASLQGERCLPRANRVPRASARTTHRRSRSVLPCSRCVVGSTSPHCRAWAPTVRSG